MIPSIKLLILEILHHLSIKEAPNVTKGAVKNLYKNTETIVLLGTKYDILKCKKTCMVVLMKMMKHGCLKLLLFSQIQTMMMSLNI